MVSVVIHTNPGLPNQRDCAAWLKSGFQKHNIDAEITGNRTAQADVVIAQGPWYAYTEALERSKTAPTLWLNRCFLGHYYNDLSLGWLRPDGSRDFKFKDEPHFTPPELKPRKTRRRCAIVFGDYGEDCTELAREARREYDSVFFRPHPSSSMSETPVMTLKGDLEAVWAIGDVAIGKGSTVLVDAEINGLHVDCRDPLSVVHHDGMSRERWLNRLTWADWHKTELQSGAFWEHLREDTI